MADRDRLVHQVLAVSVQILGGAVGGRSELGDVVVVAAAADGGGDDDDDR